MIRSMAAKVIGTMPHESKHKPPMACWCTNPQLYTGHNHTNNHTHAFNKHTEVCNVHTYVDGYVQEQSLFSPTDAVSCPFNLALKRLSRLFTIQKKITTGSVVAQGEASRHSGVGGVEHLPSVCWDPHWDWKWN